MDAGLPAAALTPPESSVEATSLSTGMRRCAVVEPFEAVVREHGPMVLRVCRAVVGPHAADDAWSETFLAALRGYPRLRPDSNVAAWLLTIAHRKGIDQLRAAARRPVPTDAVPERAARHDEGAQEWEGELWDALRALPLKQRQCVAYHHLAGMPYAEIVEIVGGTPAAARRAASDGIARLRQLSLGPGPSRPVGPPGPPNRRTAGANQPPASPLPPPDGA